jgi:type II secretory pathway pseudopilin PulG
MKTSSLNKTFFTAGLAKLERSLPTARNSADCLTPHGAKTAAFTKIELVVVVAGLGLLGAMSLAATTGSKTASDATTCVANAGQLLRAWQLYSADNHGKLVPNGDEGNQTEPQWCAGVLSYASGNTDNTNYVGLVDYGVGRTVSGANKGGLLGVYLGHDPRVFKCPSDLSTCKEGGVTYPRVRSVSMNGWVGAFITWDGGGVVAQKMTDIVNPGPSDTWVFNDERPDSINDGYFTVAMASPQVLDAPASYHFGGAAHSFADGHAEVHPWKTALLNRQDVNAPTWTKQWGGATSTNNVDREWLQLHSAQFSPNFVLVP